jgi:hypothetical protein
VDGSVKAVAIDKQKGELEHRLDEITHRKGEHMRDQEEVKDQGEAGDPALQEAAEQAKRAMEDSANREASQEKKPSLCVIASGPDSRPPSCFHEDSRPLLRHLLPQLLAVCSKTFCSAEPPVALLKLAAPLWSE